METLVLPGCGPLCIAQLGALHGLRERGELRALKHVICASGGALVWLAYTTGMGLEHLQAQLERWTPVFDPTLLPATWGVLTEQSQLELTRLAESAVCAHTGLSPGFTFADLHARYPLRFTVIATDVERAAPAAFDHETHPTAPVFDAVSASIAIPFVFRPIQWGRRLYADGELVLWSALRAFGDPRTMGAVAVCTAARETTVAHAHLWRYASAIFSTIFHQHYDLYRHGLHRQHTCEVHVAEAHLISLKPSPECLRTLYATGLAAAHARDRE